MTQEQLAVVYATKQKIQKAMRQVYEDAAEMYGITPSATNYAALERAMLAYQKAYNDRMHLRERMLSFE